MTTLASASPAPSVVAIGRVQPEGVTLLGTGFFLPASGLVATAAHVISRDDKNLVVSWKDTLVAQGMNAYQDTTDRAVRMTQASVRAYDAFHDLCVLELAVAVQLPHLSIQGTDPLSIGEPLAILGYPHADHGRMVLTEHRTTVGAKVLIDSGGIKGKHVVLNTQTRPGQSGSPVFRVSDVACVAVLIGSYAPSANSGISLGGIDPHTLHQTTHAVSSEYLLKMM